MRKKVRSSPKSVSHTMSLKSAELTLHKNIVEAKASYENKLVLDCAFKNNNKIYSHIRSLTKSSSYPSTMHLDSRVESSDMGLATIFNEYFYSVFTSSSVGSDFMSCSNSSVPTSNLLSDIDISVSEVYKGLASLDVGKAMGVDGIPNYVLKHCSISLCEPIHHLFVQCLQQAYLPKEWRIHKIIPIHKSKDISSVKNYRPISLLCCISKVLERIVFDKVYDHLSMSLSNSQFGFLRGRSTVQQLLIFYDSVINAVACKAQMDVLYFDIKKAFDSVSHQTLLYKLSKFGLCGKVWEFFSAYLTSRLQCVSINNILSDLLPVTSGVPQGSILGPLCFILYINDLPSYIRHSLLVIFADDTKCGRMIKTVDDCSLLQMDINAISNWSTENKLPLHKDKTLCIRFCSSRINPICHSYHINGIEVQANRSCRDLGVYFSSDLSWSTHIEKILSKAYQTLFLIKRSFSNTSNITVKKQLYLSLIFPIVTYGSPIWWPYNLKDIIALEKLQRRATKFIVNDHSMNYKSRLLSLNMLPLMYRLELFDIMFCVSSLSDSSSKSHFNIEDYISFNSSNTRSGSHFKMNVRSATTNQLRHSYFYRLPRLWNSLPPIDPKLSKSTIKRAILNHLNSNFISKFDCNIPCTFHYVCPCNSCSLIPSGPLF